jgi:hypothetical protein
MPMEDSTVLQPIRAFDTVRSLAAQDSTRGGPPLRLRVSVSALHCDRVLHAGQPFSGTLFHVDDALRAWGVVVRDGKKAMAYQPYVGDPDRSVPLIDLTGRLPHVIPADAWPLHWQGKPFTGVGVEFRRLRCVREVFFDNGIATRECRWSDEGTLLSEQHGGPVERSYTWFPNGALKGARMEAAGVFSATFGFTDDKKLHAMRAHGHPLQWEGVKHPLGVSLPVHPRSYGRFAGARGVCLAGDFIDDVILESLVAAGTLRDTTRLELVETQVSPWAVHLLAGMPRLEELMILRAGGQQSQLAQLAKLHNARLIVVYNERTVVAPCD